VSRGSFGEVCVMEFSHKGLTIAHRCRISSGLIRANPTHFAVIVVYGTVGLKWRQRLKNCLSLRIFILEIKTGPAKSRPRSRDQHLHYDGEESYSSAAANTTFHVTSHQISLFRRPSCLCKCNSSLFKMKYLPYL